MTLVARIESVRLLYYSWPLQPLSNDPNDTEALIPGHFLIGQLLITMPSDNFIDLVTNHLTR